MFLTGQAAHTTKDLETITIGQEAEADLADKEDEADKEAAPVQEAAQDPEVIQADPEKHLEAPALEADREEAQKEMMTQGQDETLAQEEVQAKADKESLAQNLKKDMITDAEETIKYSYFSYLFLMQFL